MSSTQDRELAVALECVNDADPDGCAGPVEYRTALSGSGESFPRCDKHWEIRLDTEQRLRQDYPDSPNPPDWFDPANAGEHWDSD
ncbi:MAG: hypothetical protein ACRDSN_19950 [Pseudonocardiaceae bacterium]